MQRQIWACEWATDSAIAASGRQWRSENHVRWLSARVLGSVRRVTSNEYCNYTVIKVVSKATIPTMLYFHQDWSSQPT